ncbi:Folylpolyglutamate synthase, mitochondrial [Frankliniella fusca]|uniref:Folylpolyglutamate synthase n=1 Tax=Frankliniella fusca TaxID=407009 RepID=A0AAE1HYD7_9NEOP|nr:Folylpolyglutamate synthase, mitochondrial [Frankliniella fusca]
MQELGRSCGRGLSPRLRRLLAGRLHLQPLSPAPGTDRGGAWNPWSRSIPSRTMSDHASPRGLGYEDAIEALNSLQSNAAYITDRTLGKRENGFSFTKKYSAMIGLGPNELSNLSVIHVAGTKGKGSTSALCESILRHNGFRTGFFSSPHLVSVRERIKIEGKSISREKFTRYFWEIFRAMEEKKDLNTRMPPYFVFLTIMAFKVFLEEKVDVAILEVGIGGEQDSTNILQNVSVVGITSLGIDHTALLGNTLSSIAWQKAGILKPTAVGYTVPDHTEEALKVLAERSQERKCPLLICPPLDKYTWPDTPSRQAASSLFRTQKLNASLALQLTNAWMQRNRNSGTPKPAVNLNLKEASPFCVSQETATGLFSCRWPGRMQILESDCKRIKYFIDGAHTVDSMAACVEWYSKHRPLRQGVKHALLFNMTGDRDRLNIIKPLLELKFDKVMFSPNVASSSRGENQNLRVPLSNQLQQTQDLHDLWVSQTSLRENNKNSDNQLQTNTSVKHCVLEALAELQNEEEEWCVLVTGSLHLVGAVLSIVDPTLEKSEKSWAHG